MTRLARYTRMVAGALALLSSSAIAQPAPEAVHWEPTGWGGGGFFYAAAFHPTQDGVIYLGGDVNGAYKSTDSGKTWRLINKGITGYGIFSLAVDPSNPETVWAGTDEGLSKSVDGGETWTTIPGSGRRELRLTGEKNKSTHNVAVDPADGNTVYVGTPHGQIHKTIDGGQTWKKVYEPAQAAESTPSIALQLGKVNEAFFGGMWMPLKSPESIPAAEINGIGFSAKTTGVAARDVFFTVNTSTGLRYRSRNLHEQMAAGDWRDVVLASDDFVLDPEIKSKAPEKAATAPATPDWSTVNRFDFSGVAMHRDGQAIRMGRIFFTSGPAEQPVKVTAIDFSEKKTPGTYGNFRVGSPAQGPVLSVAVSPSDRNTVAAATLDHGVLLSSDAGETWRQVGPMKKAAAIVFAPSQPNTLYAACKGEHVWKSTDGGGNWSRASEGIPEAIDIRDVVVSSQTPDDVFAIGAGNWSGSFFASSDGGKSWTSVASLRPDPVGNPTLPAETAAGSVPLSVPPNLAINPQNPKQLFIAANWRNAISYDGGKTWEESSRGADISCVGDIRFHGGKVYTASMDEGVVVSEDNGATWKQYWPLRHNNELSGHYWRLDIREVNGQTRIISASSPWDRSFNQVVVSNDDGKSFKAHRTGLPDYLPTANTMWGRGYARALAVDPSDPSVVYLGIDGDPSAGKSGGGVFKSTDGGVNWQQLPSQPGSRRMFFGLAVDPTQPQRLFWGACGENGGLYRSENGGQSWERVFSQEQWIFNLHVTADGTVYCLGKQIYRSTDHGKTWKALAKLPGSGTVVAFETHPTQPDTIWAAMNYWGGHAQQGGIYKSTDAGKTWTDITGDLPYRRPLLLRFNADTSELWAGNVGLYRLKQ